MSIHHPFMQKTEEKTNKPCLFVIILVGLVSLPPSLPLSLSVSLFLHPLSNTPPHLRSFSFPLPLSLFVDNRCSLFETDEQAQEHGMPCLTNNCYCYLFMCSLCLSTRCKKKGVKQQQRERDRGGERAEVIIGGQSDKSDGERD